MKTKPLPGGINWEAQAPRLIALGLLLLVIAFFLTGCKTKGSAVAEVNPAGEYTLISVDARSLPCSLNHQGTPITVKSGAFTINTNGSCRSRITFSVSPAGEVTREVQATYKLQQAKLVMQSEGAGITRGEIAGNRFTMTNEGNVFCYEKQ